MLVPDSSWSLYDYVHRHRKGNGDFDSYANKALAEHGYELPPEKIVQIKRKANLVNSDPYEYRPFVQDFVKSGKWSDVGDLANTGLVKINGGSTNIYDGPNKYKGLTVPDAGYYTPRELADHFETQGVPRLAARQHAGDIDGLTEALTPPEGFSTGGRVSMIHPAAAIQPLVRVPGFDRF